MEDTPQSQQMTDDQQMQSVKSSSLHNNLEMITYGMIKEEHSNDIRQQFRSKAILLSRGRINSAQITEEIKQLVEEPFMKHDNNGTQQVERLAQISNALIQSRDQNYISQLFAEVNDLLNETSDEGKAQFFALLLEYKHIIDALKMLVVYQGSIVHYQDRVSQQYGLSFLNKLTTQHIESVSILIKKGFVDALAGYFITQSRLDITSTAFIACSEAILVFFEKAIAFDENIKALILSTIPIQFFIFLFFEPVLQNHPSFLNNLALFLNKCCLVSSFEQESAAISHTLALYCQTSFSDFIEALSLHINNQYISIHLSEIVTHYASATLKSSLIISPNLIQSIKQLIEVQVKSEFTPLRIQVVNLLAKLFSNSMVFKMFNSQWKQEAMAILRESITSNLRLIRQSTLQALISLLRFWEEESMVIELVQYFVQPVLQLVMNDSKPIQMICMDFFAYAIRKIIQSHSQSAEIVLQKIQLCDCIQEKMLQMVEKESFVSDDSTEYSLKILNLLEAFIGFNLTQASFLEQMQGNSYNSQVEKITELLSKIQQQSYSEEVKEKVQTLTSKYPISANFMQ